ncbi:MAG: cytochrome d ubiquinol oxidase subunit II [Pseudonocardiales bacterium]|nr:cytochrome d ubiquinol oxidase subunit II [Pseudonocardiales bacterium]
MAQIAWYAITLFCLAMYVLLDGYDLGIGVLLLADRDDERRREMVELVATAWDGNESWLVLLGVALFGGLPAAYGVLLPALYVPVLVMLFAIIFRGVAIEMISAAPGFPRGWGWAFGLGSLVASFAQGVTLGGLLSGVALRGGVFAGASFDFLTPYAVLTGFAAVALYATAGAAVLRVKTEGAFYRRAMLAGRAALVATVALAAASAAALAPATATPVRLGEPGRLAAFVVLVLVAAAGLGLAGRGFGRRLDWVATAGVTVAEGAGLAGLLVAIYPVVVPPRLDLAAAAAPAGSLNFLLVGVGVNLPLVLFYNWYAHHVFRGKYRVLLAARPTGQSAAARATDPTPATPRGKVTP